MVGHTLLLFINLFLKIFENEFKLDFKLSSENILLSLVHVVCFTFKLTL